MEWIYYKKHEKYLHFLSFLKTEMSQVVEILPHWRQGPVDPA